MSFSDYLEGKVLDHVFGLAAFTQPTLYIALSTADPTDAGSGLTEPAGNGYARVQHSGWSRTGNTVSNSTAVTFPQATGSWGTITHFAIMDAATAGNVLASGSVSPSQAVVSGNTVEFAIGDLQCSLD